MINKLIRNRHTEQGIFGEFWFEGDVEPFMATLEHSYSNEPKVPVGAYLCVRGTHSLHDGVSFSTFEITGVPGHQGILFHVGNVNDDSEGCVLCGEQSKVVSITNSRKAFSDWCNRLIGVTEFILVVSDE